MRHFISQIWLMANVCVPERHQIACPDSTHRHTQSYTLIVVLSRQANKETNESQAHTVCTRENPQGNADSQTMQTARVTSRSHCLKLNIWVWTFFCNKLHHNVSLWMCCNWLTDTFFQFSAVCVSWSSLLCSYCVIALDGREQSPAVCCGLVFLVYKTRFTDDLCMRTIRLTYFLQSSHHWLHLFQHFLLFLTLWGWSHPQPWTWEQKTSKKVCFWNELFPANWAAF